MLNKILNREKSHCDPQAGAAFPAKKTTRGTTFSLSAGFMLLRTRYLCKTRAIEFPFRFEYRSRSHMDDSQDIESLTLSRTG